MNKPLAREYVGRGVVVTIQFEDDYYSVLINRPDHEHLITHYESPRERPARSKFDALVAELTAQHEAQGRRWDR